MACKELRAWLERQQKGAGVVCQALHQTLPIWRSSPLHSAHAFSPFDLRTGCALCLEAASSVFILMFFSDRMPLGAIVLPRAFVIIGRTLMDKETKEMKLAYWTGIIKESKSSGMKISDWCRMNQISRRQYYYWHRKVMHDTYETAVERGCFRVRRLILQAGIFRLFPNSQNLLLRPRIRRANIAGPWG